MDRNLETKRPGSSSELGQSEPVELSPALRNVGKATALLIAACIGAGMNEQRHNPEFFPELAQDLVCGVAIGIAAHGNGAEVQALKDDGCL